MDAKRCIFWIKSILTMKMANASINNHLYRRRIKSIEMRVRVRTRVRTTSFFSHLIGRHAKCKYCETINLVRITICCWLLSFARYVVAFLVLRHSIPFRWKFQSTICTNLQLLICFLFDFIVCGRVLCFGNFVWGYLDFMQRNQPSNTNR